MTIVMSRIKLSLLICGGGLFATASLVYAAVFPAILGAGVNSCTPVVGGPATVTFRQLTTTPGDIGAWHYHPGYVHNVVTSGAIKIEDGCGGSSTFAAGQAFETSEGRVHRAINEGAVDATELNVFIREEGKPLTRFIPANRRRCGPPGAVYECRDGGWMRFDFPNTFPNQGSCIEYVLRRPKVNLLVPQDPLR